MVRAANHWAPLHFPRVLHTMCSFATDVNMRILSLMHAECSQGPQSATLSEAGSLNVEMRDWQVYSSSWELSAGLSELSERGLYSQRSRLPVSAEGMFANLLCLDMHRGVGIKHPKTKTAGSG